MIRDLTFMSIVKKKHPLAIRWFHWINLPLLFLMLWSGLLIYWSNAVYRLGIGRYTLFTFFPDSFFDTMGVPYRLAEGMALHFFFLWFFAINGLLYVTYTAVSGEWRYLVPNRRSFPEAIRVVLHDLHLTPPSREALPPSRRALRRTRRRTGPIGPAPRKFNGAQQIAYTGVILMGAASLVTGLAIYKPVQFAWLTDLLGGYAWARWQHFWLAAGYVVFLTIHLAQVARAGWNTFRAMVTGYEVAPS